MPRALVTGASRGIGKKIASRFADAGYDVLAPSRAELDLADTAAVERYAKQIESMQIDVLINNAGENVPVSIDDVTTDGLRRIAAVNTFAPFVLTQHVAKGMASREQGRIVNISSVYSQVGRAGRAMYTTTKAALNGFTRAVAVELGPKNVLVNAVCPGFVNTDLTVQNNTPNEIAALCGLVPLGRLAEPVEIAALVYFLGSDQNTYITGQVIAIDGGFLCS